MESWGGAQWVLATVFAVMTATPPFLRMGLLRNGAKQNTTWPEFWVSWGYNLAERVGLVLILLWGGFW